jgi:membrane protein
LIERNIRRSGSSLFDRGKRLLEDTVQKFDEHECALRAAGLAYHLLLSLFPLLLFLVFLGSRYLSTEGVRQSLMRYMEEVIPAAANSVRLILDQTLKARGTIGAFSGVLLLWSASGVFISLSSALNVIWNASPRSFWQLRIVAIVTILVIGSLFIISIWLSALTPWPWFGTDTILWRWIRICLDLLVTVLLLGLLYRMIPNRSVPWRFAFSGAFLGGVLWQVAKAGFIWFITSGLINYGLVYGSLASVVTLMLWTYLSAAILFIGAAFGYVFEMHYQSRIS